MLLILGSLLAALPSAPPAPPAGSLSAVRLSCEHRVDPQGIGETSPRFGWELQANDPRATDLRQTGYEIIVAGSPETLSQGRGEIWDTGRVSSDRSAEIPFAGQSLRSGEQLWWAVRVWDQDGRASAWSQPARWTMGILSKGEWKAQWIGLDAPALSDASALTADERQRLAGAAFAQAPGPDHRNEPAVAYIRRGFTLPADRKLVRARFIVVPNLRCTISLNGGKVGEVVRWVPAQAMDLTSQVVAGDNFIGLTVVQDDGYRAAALGELALSFADGGYVRLPIDATWHCAETAAAGWDSPGGEDARWIPLTVGGKDGSPLHNGLNELHVYDPAPYLQRSFMAKKDVRRATLYATALGLYEVSINGYRVGTDYFTPGWTDYTRRVGVQSYDVTARLASGVNVIDATLGDGWYAGIAAFIGRRHIYGGYPRFAAQLEIDYADGTHETVVTDPSWRGAFGPIRYADLLQGCAYDARLAPKDWGPVDAGLRATGGEDSLLTTPVIEPARMDAAKVSQQLSAKRVLEPQPGVYVVDFGQNMVGWVRLSVRGAAGQRVVVRHGEMLNSNGTIYTSNLRGAAATDIYWLKGQGEEILEPHFTFHGFRYAEITGLTAAPAPDSIKGIVVGSPIRRTGEFICSNPLLNQLYSNIIWSQRGNYLEVPTDCPQRDERLGWTGDTQFFIPTAAFNFDVASFIERWLVDMRDGQGPDGTFPDVAPATTRPDKAITAWGGDAAIVCTHELWRTYGDTRVIEENFDALLRYIDWLEVSAQKDVLTVGGYEDWLNKGGGAPPEVIDTAYGAYLAGIMADMARAIGREAEAARLADLRQKFATGFRQDFIGADGRIRDSGQTAYALAFSMDLVPAALRTKAADAFVADIASHNWHLATGFIGTPRLLPALHDAGRDDVAYRLLLQDTFPSWLFQVREGATTMWERWDGWTPDRGFQTIDMNSFNHYAFGAVGQFLYQDILGIDAESPGYRRILIRPVPGGGLTQAKGSFDSPAGTIACAWSIEGNQFVMDVTIPPNTTARIVLPSGATHEVGSGPRHFSEPAAEH